MKNGTWTGMIGMIMRGEADVALSGFFNTPERSKVVHFMIPFLKEPYGGTLIDTVKSRTA